MAIAITLVLTTVLRAQSPPTAPSEPAFEVASVKRNVSGDTRAFFQVRPVGTVSFTNATLRQIVEQAYELGLVMARFTLVVPANHPLLRGGDPIEQMAAPRFDIQGKPPEGAESGSTRAMLRTLLADRFKLRVHREKRELPVYALTVAREGRFGPAFRASSVDCVVYETERRKNRELQPPQDASGRSLCTSVFSSFNAGKITLRSAGAMNAFIGGLQPFVDRPIVDDTGLNGLFEWTLTIGFSSEDPTFDTGEAAMRREIREQLGLSLEPRNAPYEVLVIDSVDMPTEN